MNSFITILNDRGLRGKKRGGGGEEGGAAKEVREKKEKVEEKRKKFVYTICFTTKTNLK